MNTLILQLFFTYTYVYILKPVSLTKSPCLSCLTDKIWKERGDGWRVNEIEKVSLDGFGIDRSRRDRTGQGEGWGEEGGRSKRAREGMSENTSARNSRRSVSKCYPACKKGQSSLARACGNGGGGVARRGDGMTCGVVRQPRAARAKYAARNAVDRMGDWYGLRRLPLRSRVAVLIRVPRCVIDK